MLGFKIAFFATIIVIALSAECHHDPGPHSTNLNPIWKGEPKFIKSHSHGKLYEIGEGSTKMKLLHVYGDMYQMGYAHGYLLKDELTEMMTEVWQYIKD
jgi:hypothetical protein